MSFALSGVHTLVYSFKIQNPKSKIIPLFPSACAFNDGCQYPLDRLDLFDQWIDQIRREDQAITSQCAEENANIEH